MWCCKAEHVAPKAKRVIDGSGTVHRGCLQHPHRKLLHLPLGETSELRVEPAPLGGLGVAFRQGSLLPGWRSGGMWKVTSLLTSSPLHPMTVSVGLLQDLGMF